MVFSDSARDLEKTWELFVSGGEPDLSVLRPEIADSWRRCRESGVSHRRDRAPEAPGVASPLDEDLTRASGPVVSFVNDALIGAGTLIDLANREARILLTVGGNRALDAATRINGLPGSLWDESTVGTTVLGTGIICRKPLEIKWYEHYVAEWHKWACCSAPIFHPFQGELIGTLAIAGFREVAHPRMLELAIHASGLITDSIRKLESQRRLVLSNVFEDFLRRYPDAPVLAFDAYGQVVQANGRAIAALGGGSSLSGRRIGDMAGLEDLTELTAGESPGRPRDRVLQLDGRAVSAAIHPVTQDARPIGNVLLMSAPKPVPSAKPAKQQWTTRYSFANILGSSAALQQAVRVAVRAAATDYPILLVGESGTGKELFAHAVHDAGARRDGPFVAFNCGTLSAELAVAEMCGHEPGAFTGADRRTRAGVFDAAHGGTLFLDELQDMDPRAQSLLLRFLETGTFVRVGGTVPVKADVRVIAASNVAADDLEQRRILRPDLLYRLNCIAIDIPPLRERSEDIRPIAEKCLRDELRFCGDVEEAVWVALRHAAWPGNVRQLRNVLLRATLACARERLTVWDLPRDLLRRGEGATPDRGVRLEEREREELVEVLQTAGGDIREAARRLGIHRSTLYRRLARAGISANNVGTGGVR